MKIDDDEQNTGEEREREREQERERDRGGRRECREGKTFEIKWATVCAAKPVAELNEVLHAEP